MIFNKPLSNFSKWPIRRWHQRGPVPSLQAPVTVVAKRMLRRKKRRTEQWLWLSAYCGEAAMMWKHLISDRFISWVSYGSLYLDFHGYNGLYNRLAALGHCTLWKVDFLYVSACVEIFCFTWWLCHFIGAWLYSKDISASFVAIYMWPEESC